MLEGRHLAERIALQEFVPLVGAFHERYFGELVGVRFFGQCKPGRADIGAEIRAIDDRRCHGSLLTMVSAKSTWRRRPGIKINSREPVRPRRIRDIWRGYRWSIPCPGDRSCARARLARPRAPYRAIHRENPSRR